jgi:hypothetical protein
VKVTGRVANVREYGWRRPYYTFDLSDGPETIRVIAFGNAPCRSGTVTVEGTFGQIKWPVNLRASYDEIMAESVVCIPDPVPPQVGCVLCEEPP